MNPNLSRYGAHASITRGFFSKQTAGTAGSLRRARLNNSRVLAILSFGGVNSRYGAHASITRGGTKCPILTVKVATARTPQ